ncbi:glycosyltransferase family 2 protein [Leucobacter sp. CSA1]|uniref:Glycosyltransferase family 2 protein n=1 Tax=Leucobacter chromiisoli TaxID=2796471 RepID=A0A934Q8V0_9MICO|nr:glycosyltransferase family 2 protein [Leucobacter chromiisoli]MBK0420359.1 glycosyltransferase family 2 protein [Leucobacter chromiisoli]
MIDLPPLPELPAVSYVMPVLNEEDYLEAAVRTILDQDYAGEKEIVLALGPSRDRSDEIAARLAGEDPRVRLVENPERDIPAGLNRAIAASRHPVIVRVDAHSELTPDYTRLGIRSLRDRGAVNVGGIMRAAGSTPVQRAIARAYNSPFGLGGGAYHGDGTPGPAESAYLGIFRREAVEAAGGYDPTILRGEDWELNLRIRRGGGLIWFDPELRVTYRPRASIGDLARQFFATGTWRAVLVRRYRGANPWRFFMPGGLVAALAASLVLAMLQFLGVAPWASWWSLLHLSPAAYALAIAFAVTTLPDQRGLRDRILSAIALVTMHLSWGTGFLKGIVRGGGRTVDRSRA